LRLFFAIFLEAKFGTLRQILVSILSKFTPTRRWCLLLLLQLLQSPAPLVFVRVVGQRVDGNAANDRLQQLVQPTPEPPVAAATTLLLVLEQPVHAFVDGRLRSRNKTDVKHA
jgi:hypothetical protein